jgi:hypothetical protein
MAKEFLPLFLDFNETTQDLNDEQCGRLVRALVDYANGIERDIDGMELLAFRFLKGSIDRNEKLSAVRAAAGSKGGKQTQANASKNRQAEANASKDQQNDINNDNDINKNTDNKTRRFTPPTLQEVTDYCQERDNGVNPARFIDFYASKGWKVGNQPMKDWKACVRTWESRGQKNEVTVSAQAYEQRDYSGIQDELMRKQNERILKRLQEVG